MPELPEVETIFRQLNNELSLKDQWWTVIVDRYQMMQGQRVTQLLRTQRKGKNIVLYGQHFYVHIHLRMSGRIHVMRSVAASADEVAAAYRHLTMSMVLKNEYDNEKSFRLVCTDSRGFGLYRVCDHYSPDVDAPPIVEVGIDPTYPEFTFEAFSAAIRRYPKQAIGTVLINQKVIGGIGDIYRSEILFQAGVNPLRQVNSLSKDEVWRIYECTTGVINTAINYNGCSMLTSQSTYRDLYGNKGRMAYHLAVYQRNGLPCLNCGVGRIEVFEIERMRRMYHCSKCQV